ncbi:MAG: VWA domain-containing protein [Cryomorphaceae bacterium]|nr:VWA domain-containing protein [Cryomorphaceae bacterium]
MKKSVYFLLVCFFALNATANVKFNADKLALKPTEFHDNPRSTLMDSLYSGRLLIEDLSYDNSRFIWIVYSDRAKNAYYSDFSFSRKAGELDFMEPLYIKEVRGSSVRVSALQRQNSTGGFDMDVDLGWVSVQSLVLNNKTLINDRGFTKKSMTLVSISENFSQREIRSLRESSEYDLYYDPSLKIRKGAEGRFVIRYYLKEFQGSVLLSTIDNIERKGELENKVSGWIQKSKTTDWDTRVCLEPTTSPSAVRLYDNREIPLFRSKNHLTQFLQRGGSTIEYSIHPRVKLDGNRKHPGEMRMPILNYDESLDIYEVATFLSLNQVDGNRFAVANEALESFKKKQKNFNIIFIVDATNSMDPYLRSVGKSIQRIIDNKDGFNDEDISVRFGLIVYRDYPDGEDALVVEPLTNDHQRIKIAIDRTEAKSIAVPRAEAVYHGIVEGLKKMNPPSDESNIVVLVGDCGNHEDDPKGYTVNDVVQTLNNFKANLIVFQVANGDNVEYIKFQSDARRKLREIGRLRVDGGQTEDIRVRLETAKLNLRNTNFLSVMRDGDDVSHLHVFGRYTYASEGETMNPTLLEENIRDATTAYISAVRAKINEYETIQNRGVRKSTDFQGKQIDEYSLRRLCEDLHETDPSIKMNECIEIFSNFGDISLRAYLSMKTHGQVLPAFDYVVFLSQSELSQLAESYQRLSDQTARYSEKIQKLYEALLDQTLAKTGDMTSFSMEEKVNQMTLNQIWNKLFNLPFDGNNIYGNLGNTKLGDILILKDNDRKYLEAFIRNNFENMRFNPSRFSNHHFDLNGTRFYWIPLAELPGNA